MTIGSRSEGKVFGLVWLRHWARSKRRSKQCRLRARKRMCLPIWVMRCVPPGYVTIDGYSGPAGHCPRLLIRLSGTAINQVLEPGSSGPDLASGLGENGTLYHADYAGYGDQGQREGWYQNGMPCAADVNHDGLSDIFCGGFLYDNPERRRRRHLRVIMYIQHNQNLHPIGQPKLHKRAVKGAVQKSARIDQTPPYL